MEWVKPDYKLVDLMDYEMKLERRRDIEDFCVKFFRDYWSHSTDFLIYSCEAIIKEKRLGNITQDLSREITLNNFKDTFQIMCTELFKGGETSDAYVVSLLAFCIELDTYLEEYIWYTPHMLITILVDALEKVEFYPHCFYWTSQPLLDSLIASFGIIVPTLLFLYALFR